MVQRDPRHLERVEARLERLAHARSNLSRAEAAVLEAVKRARAEGATWTEVGLALGISQQGAQKRYGSVAERADVVEARNTRRAAKAAEKRHAGAEPWPDGTVQGIIDSGSD